MYLIDMFEYAEAIVGRMPTLTREQYDADVLLRLGLANALQNIGEAAYHVSEATRLAFPELPWQRIVGMRHRLVHEYFQVKTDLVWDAAANDIPALIIALESVVRPLLKNRPKGSS